MTKMTGWMALGLSVAVTLGCSLPGEGKLEAASEQDLKVVFVAGSDSHGEGAHDHGPGSDLLAKHLRKSLPGVEAVVVKGGWPDDASVFEGADTVVMYCDGGRGHVMNHDLGQFDKLLSEKVGTVFLHYGVEVTKGSDSSEKMLEASGGYFETHWSVNPHWTAEFTELPEHPISRGVNPFSMQDEWYFNMRFVPNMKGITPILSAVPPKSTMKRENGPHSGNDAVRKMVSDRAPQHVGWAYSRPNGGRGFGFTGGHFHKNWQHPDFRKTVLNAIVWTAGGEVPENGVESLALTQSENSVPLKLFDVPDDLEVTVWAQSPQFFNPTNMDVDALGRIWVAEGRNYRGNKTSPGGDRIVIVEDSDSDGKADRSSVFVQDKELVAPLGIAVIDNQVVVSQPPNLILYTDVNRDSKFDAAVDKKEYLLSGFGGKNHDHSLHSLTAGPDGKWYFNIGNAGTGELTDNSGQTFRIGSHYRNTEISGMKSDDGHVYVGGSAFRMNPDGTDLEVIGYNFRNSYEQTLTSFGDVFQNDNDDPPNCRTTWLMEYGNLGFASQDGKTSWQNDIRPGQSSNVAHWRQDDPGTIPAGDVYGGGSPTGITQYENGALGKQYRGLLLSAEPARNLVFGYFPEAKQSGFELTSNRFDFMSSNSSGQFAGVDFKGGGRSINNEVETLFRPSDVTVGPDGAIYVADWFDPRVGGHSTHDKSGSGTIYRIAPKGFKPKVPSIDLSTLKGQLLALQSPAINVRATGFKALRTRGDNAFGPVKKLLSHENTYIQARALWLLAELGEAGLMEVKQRLQDPAPQMRMLALRILRRHDLHMPYLKALAKDSSSRVRREVALALRDVPFEQSKDLLLSLAEGYDGADRWYLEAWGMGAFGHEEKIYPLLKKRLGSDALKWDARFEGLAWRLHVKEALPDFVKRASSTTLETDQRIRMLTAIAFTEGRESTEAMIRLSKLDDEELFNETTKFWLTHPKFEHWKTHPELQAYFKPQDVKQDFLAPTQFGAISDLPSSQKILSLKGDAVRGKAVASRCAMCHQINEEVEAQYYGPNLSAYGKTQPRDVIVKAILDPSEDIAHGFRGYEYQLENGHRVQGIEVAQDSKVYSVRVFGGNILVLSKKEVKKRRWIPESLMPPAKNMGLKPQELRDVVEYLKVGMASK